MSNWYFGTEDEMNVLQHYGVLGMKWGVRKDRSSGGSRGSGGNRQSKLAAKYRAKGMSKVQAEKKAKRRVMAERAALGVGAAAAAAGAGYAAYKYGKKHNTQYYKNIQQARFNNELKRSIRNDGRPDRVTRAKQAYQNSNLRKNVQTARFNNELKRSIRNDGRPDRLTQAKQAYGKLSKNVSKNVQTQRINRELRKSVNAYGKPDRVAQAKQAYGKAMASGKQAYNKAANSAKQAYSTAKKRQEFKSAMRDVNRASRKMVRNADPNYQKLMNARNQVSGAYKNAVNAGKEAYRKSGVNKKIQANRISKELRKSAENYAIDERYKQIRKENPNLFNWDAIQDSVAKSIYGPRADRDYMEYMRSINRGKKRR